MIEKQKKFYRSGKTREVAFRKEQLRRLKKMLVENQDRLSEAVYRDFKKPEFEVVSGELVTIIDDINLHLKHLESWVRPKNVGRNLFTFPSGNQVHRFPFGVTLIISAWNYPVNLLLHPLVGAISGGNCAVLKPSEIAPETSELLNELISSTFDEEYITVIEGGVDTNQKLLSEPFDKIFFTGSSQVGKIVMKKAAEQLIPVTLELGGKSPAVVHKNANIEVSARRTIWGKCWNAGQTCMAPDFALVHEEVKSEFIDFLKRELNNFFPDGAKNSSDFARIINRKHFDRIAGLMEGTNLLAGGDLDPEELYIGPAVVDGADWHHPIMKEEIFGPILPVMTYSNIDNAIRQIRELPAPLSLYIFDGEDEVVDRFIHEVPHGISCVNDVMIQASNPHLPFGGMGESGMGQYHGKFSFKCFTRPHGVMKRRYWPDPKFRYPSYSESLNFIKRFLVR